jgi:tetratricopeptide (TPR) repeat protein
MINGAAVELPAAEAGNWKPVRELEVSGRLRPGENEVVATMFSDSGYPALWLVLAAEGATGRRPLLVSDAEWESSHAGATWRPARLAALPMPPGIQELATQGGYRPLRTTMAALGCRWPTLLVFAAIAAGAVFVAGRWERRRRLVQRGVGGLSGAAEALPGRWAAALLVACALAWVVLFANNLHRLHVGVGFDSYKHLDYVQHILTERRLPLPSDGWQMYQPPLYYLLCAVGPAVAGLDVLSDGAAVWMRLLGLACGLAQMALTLACLRLLFPDERRKQVAGLVLAVFLPMNLYMFQYVTNEGLAAVLVTAAVYLCLNLLGRERAATWLYVALGLALGAALLAKFSALLAAPVVFAVLAGRLLARRERRLPEWLRTVALPLAVCLLVCGWHFGRVWYHCGQPLVGNWDSQAGRPWWQDPGYHTGSYYLSFGRSLVQPVFAGLGSFGDAIYSTLWGDGFCGGVSKLRARPPWDYDLMAVGYLLAVPLSLLILVGLSAALVRLVRAPRAAWFLLVGLAFSALAAVCYMTLKLPYYGQAKAFYGMMAAVPLAAFAAWGFDLLARPWRWLRAALWLLLVTWAITSYATYWIRAGDSRSHDVYGMYLYLEKDYERAAAQFAEAARMDGHDSDARWGLGTTCAALGREDEALAEFRRALEDDPQDGDCHLGLAHTYARQRRFSEAERHARLAVAASPDDAEAYHLLGLVLRDEGQTAEAVEALREAIRAGPDFVDAQRTLGTVYFSQGRYGEALECYQCALRLRPDDARTALSLAWLLATCPEGRFRDGQRAVRLAEDALRQSGAVAVAAVVLDTLAAAYAEAGRFQDAVNVADQLVQKLQRGGRAELASQVQARLELYRAGKPYREARPEQKTP